MASPLPWGERVRVRGNILCPLPPPEPCKVQGFVLHPTWCRVNPPPSRGRKVL